MPSSTSSPSSTSPPYDLGDLELVLKQKGLIRPAAKISDNEVGLFFEGDECNGWQEPIPKPYHDRFRQDYGPVRLQTFGSFVSKIATWYETVPTYDAAGGRFEFRVCKGFIFMAASNHERNLVLTYPDNELGEWATKNGMHVQILPKEWSNCPYRTWCIAVPKVPPPNILTTFRGYVIRTFAHLQIDGEYMLHRHLVDDDFFFDIMFCHDKVSTTLGHQPGDLNKILRRHVDVKDSDSGSGSESEEDQEQNPLFAEENELRAAITSLYARYKWTRLRSRWRLHKAVSDTFLAMFQEVTMRPGNQGAKAVAEQFYARMST